MTKNYELFKFFDFNEKDRISTQHVEQIKESIKKNGFIESNPILVNSDFYIIDGQHRFLALKELDKEIPYIIANNDESLIIDLNSTQKKWNFENYVNYYSMCKKNENYIRLLETAKKCGTTVSIIIYLSFKNHSIKNGKLNFSEKEAKEIESFYENYKYLMKILRIPDGARFCRAVRRLSNRENFKWDVMLHKAECYTSMAYKCTTSEDAIEMLVKIYNYNQKSEKNKIKGIN
jgi:hypothetical protein